MSKHTEGPWTVDQENDEYPMWIKGADGKEVLSGCGCCGSPNLGIDDARLIAAAPELLEALEELEEAARQIMTGEMEASSIMVERIKASAAIAKARGEA